MASGRMRFYSQALCGQTDFSFVIPNDVPPMMKDVNPCYQRPMKTLYLLHGYSGNDCDWHYDGVAEALSANYNLAVILLGCGNNFYLDREATGTQYGVYAGQELVDFTRRCFGLSNKREDTLIGGFSMGGFGALHTGLAYPDTFGAIIALSSALIIHEVAQMQPGSHNGVANYAYYRDIFGEPSLVEASDNNPETLYDRLRAAGRAIPPIYMAIGTEDFLYEKNQDFRAFLTERGADFVYEEGPGVHDWKFWNDYIVKGLEWSLTKL